MDPSRVFPRSRRHPLELIQFPPGKGEPRWQDKERLFLGIDHTAIAAADTEHSLAFYRDRLGFQIAGPARIGASSRNDYRASRACVSGSRRLRADSGPGIELLDY